MKEREIPEKTRKAQLAVSDPDASAWVSANAGSGKTFVLSQRVIRLLLRGAPPGRILCLTFTKAAAAHMANQVLKTLRGWVGLDDETLDKKLFRIDGGKPSADRRARARRLFATALETPGGLKVQTIHAFCDRILHQFPFEAGVPAGFMVLDDATAADLLQRARADVLQEAARNQESDLAKALALAISTATDMKLAEVFDEVVRARRKLVYLLQPEGLRQAEEAICSGLGLAPGDTVSGAEAEILGGNFLPRSEWASVAEALVALGGNPKQRGEQLAEAALEHDPHAIEAYLSVFCTDKGTMRALSGFGAEKLREKEPLLQRLVAECARLAPLVERRRAAQALERTCALNTLGRAMIANYENMKCARGALDYDDLVGKTADLLKDQAAAWVHYKLDGGIDHILIDEAQDTSPEQWDVVNELAKEFFAGKGASERPRTVFAVGDEKQSIFGFQGASPQSFGEMQTKFGTSARGAKQTFHSERLELSFRSAEPIVNAVDAVFSVPDAYRGLSHRDGDTHTIHTAIRSGAPALVEVWDLVRPPENNESELAWDAPLDQQNEGSAPVMLAQRIAKAVKAWLGKGDLLVGDPVTEDLRHPHAGDIIVLVRSRGPLFDAVLREMKQAGIPVAGADRLKLSEHIAVMDIAALCDALLLASDDLALACALKSPLFGLSEDELFAIAHGRTGTLLESLAAASGEQFSAANEKLARWCKEALSLRPFDFLTRVLGRDGGRERFLARLGIEAADAIDELLALALGYEATETPSLAGFLIFLRRGGSQVKRDLEIESHAVRVMTVHGVKGLEAPIIVLADTTSAADSKRHHPKLMPVAGSKFGPLVWAVGEDSAAIEQARAEIIRANEAEHRRLLYVALTRARDALIVCGFEAKRSEPAADSWYNLIRSALAKDEKRFIETSAHGYGFGEKVFRWRYEPGKAKAKPQIATAREIPEPGWLSAPFSSASKTVQTIEFAKISSTSRNGDPLSRAEARRRGVLVHRLLQELPRLVPDVRQERAKQYLDRFAAELSNSARAAMIAEALQVIGHPQLAELFGPKSRAEVSILGKWNESGKPFEDFGRVDRLAVTATEVWIADFKSDAVPPADPTHTPKVYLEQLARYRAVLSRLYPDKAMRALIIWTANGAVHEIPDSQLDSAFARLTAA